MACTSVAMTYLPPMGALSWQHLSEQHDRPQRARGLVRHPRTLTSSLAYRATPWQMCSPPKHTAQILQFMLPFSRSVVTTFLRSVSTDYVRHASRWSLAIRKRKQAFRRACRSSRLAELLYRTLEIAFRQARQASRQFVFFRITISAK